MREINKLLNISIKNKENIIFLNEFRNIGLTTKIYNFSKDNNIELFELDLNMFLDDLNYNIEILINKINLINNLDSNKFFILIKNLDSINNKYIRLIMNLINNKEILYKNNFYKIKKDNLIFILDINYNVYNNNLFFDKNEKTFSTFFTYIVNFNFNDWIEWTKSEELNIMIIEYLKIKKEYLFYNDRNDNEFIKITPINWIKLSNILNNEFPNQKINIELLEKNINNQILLLNIITGKLGINVGIQFFRYFLSKYMIKDILDIDINDFNQKHLSDIPIKSSLDRRNRNQTEEEKKLEEKIKDRRKKKRIYINNIESNRINSRTDYTYKK